MARNYVPKYGKHKASKQAIVTLHGKTHYLGKYGTAESKRKYDELISDYLKQRGQPVPLVRIAASAASNLTVLEACDRYLSYVRTRYKKSELFHQKSIMQIMLALFENELAANIGPGELREIRREMIARDWSRSYVNDQVARIKRMYKWLAAEPLIPITTYQTLLVVSGLRKGEEGVRETKRVRTVADAIVDATILYLPEVVADMVRLQRLTGMRPAELCMLRPCDLENRSERVWLYRPESHKTEHHDKDRVIFVGPQAQAILAKYLARDESLYCFRPCDSEAKRRIPRGRNKANPTRVPGDQYAVAAYRRAIHRACDKAFPHETLGKIKRSKLTRKQREELKQWQSKNRWSPNRLRHSAGTQVRKEFGLEAAQVVLGHSQANVTQIYAERDMALGVEVAEKIG